MDRCRGTKRAISHGALALLLLVGTVALGPGVATARWQIHNDADVTQIIAPPGGTEAETCADALQAQTAWSAPVPPGEPPSSVTPDPIAFQRVPYDVWKTPAGFTNFNLAQEIDTDNDGDIDGVFFPDATGDPVIPAILAAHVVTPARSALRPPRVMEPPLETGGDNLYLYSLATFWAPLSGVVAGDHLGVKPTSEGSTFIDLTAVRCSRPVTARVDVLPGQRINQVHPDRKRPLLPVRVYGSDALRVTSIVTRSVLLQNAAPAHVRPGLRRPFDADGDGNLDRVYYFSPAKTGIACGQTSVRITGQTSGGKRFKGTNPIRTVCP